MKTLKCNHLILVGIIVLPTIYLLIDRYIVTTDMKGISPADLKQIGAFLLFPLELL